MIVGGLLALACSLVFAHSRLPYFALFGAWGAAWAWLRYQGILEGRRGLIFHGSTVVALVLLPLLLAVLPYYTNGIDALYGGEVRRSVPDPRAVVPYSWRSGSVILKLAGGLHVLSPALLLGAVPAFLLALRSRWPSVPAAERRAWAIAVASLALAYLYFLKEWITIVSWLGD